MKKFKILLLFLMVLFLVSCSKNEECYDSHKKIMEMNSYSSNAIIKIHGNKSISTYKVNQLFEEPNKIKIETLEPKELSGKKVVYKDKKWSVYHPLIDDIVEFDALRDIDEIMYMGLIQKGFLMSEDLKEKKVSKNKKPCIEFSATLPNSNSHRNYAKLYLDEATLAPVNLEIYSDKDEITLEVEYMDFKYNPVIDAKDFSLKK